MSQSSVVTTHRTPRPDHSARLLVAAFAIADACVRSEVECWCEGHIGDDDAAWWDTSKPSGITDGTPDAAMAARNVQRALRYIGLRGADAFPWRFVRHPERPELVRFEDLA
ncbi:MAG: hypothetical protein JSS41_11870 [Proteobacteria bacterium]|nr:hypothetical protein [Pseudomonadota bacterium]